MNEVVELFRGTPDLIATFVIAMLPIAELRGAIPIGILVYDINWLPVVVVSIVGNMVPVALILLFLEPISQFLMKRYKFWDRVLGWLFERTRKKYYARFERLGDAALILFVAIPLPVTGGWTGSLAAFIFGVPRLKAFFLILLGVLIAAAIVTSITLGVFTFI